MLTGMRWPIALILMVVIGVQTGCNNPDSMNRGQQNGNRQAQAANLPGLDSLELPEAEKHKIRPETFIAAGRLHESLGRPEEAIEQYRLALKEDPRNIKALNRLGLIFNRLGKFRDALELQSRAVILAPTEAHLWNNRAFSYILQRKWTLAEADLEKALVLSPNFCRARVNLAMVLAQQGRFDEAFGRFCQALPQSDAYYNMGLMFQSKGKTAEAAWAFRNALEMDPKLSAAAKRLAKMPSEAIGAAKAFDERGKLPLPQPQEAIRGLAGIGEEGERLKTSGGDAGETLEAIREVETAEQGGPTEHAEDGTSLRTLSDEAYWLPLIDPKVSFFTCLDAKENCNMMGKRLAWR
jgi:tetratricopeptide (TPR) repeat protein